MDDNTFECPNCGAEVYPEMTRCPQCGQSMYPDDEETSQADATSIEAGWGLVLGATMLGWLIAGGIALILNFILASLVSPSVVGSVGKGVLFLAGPIGSLVGGYVCAGMVRQYSKILGGVVAALTLPVLVLLATHWVEVTPGFLLSPWVLLGGVFTILTGILGGWLNRRFSQDGNWKEKLRVRGWEDLLYQDLLRKVRFNGSIADRLIEYERKQDPQASRLKLIQNAIERWERDNR
jgi:zinc-ribbon domain